MILPPIYVAPPRTVPLVATVTIRGDVPGRLVVRKGARRWTALPIRIERPYPSLSQSLRLGRATIRTAGAATLAASTGERLPLLPISKTVHPDAPGRDRGKTRLLSCGGVSYRDRLL